MKRYSLIIPKEGGAHLAEVEDGGLVRYEDCREENRRLREALEYAAKELETLYCFAISNGISEAGTPPHKEILRALDEQEEGK